jgi:hypothetical protein
MTVSSVFHVNLLQFNEKNPFFILCVLSPGLKCSTLVFESSLRLTTSFSSVRFRSVANRF